MAGSEIPKASPERQVATQEGGRDEATQASERLSAGSFDYPKMAQAGTGDQAKVAPKPEMGTFEGQTFDVNKLASRAELQAARNEDRAALGIDPSDTSSKTYFDRSAQVAVDWFKKISPDYKAEMRREFGLTDAEFGDPAKVREAQIKYHQRNLGMPGASLDDLERRIHLINAGIKNNKLKAQPDVD